VSGGVGNAAQDIILSHKTRPPEVH